MRITLEHIDLPMRNIEIQQLSYSPIILFTNYFIENCSNQQSIQKFIFRMGNYCCEGQQHNPATNQIPDETMFKPCLSAKINNRIVQEKIDELKYRPLAIDDSKYQGLQQKGPMKEVNTSFIYQGTWKEDKPEGKGNIVFENGQYFQGEFKNGKANGKGRYIFQNGDMFEGAIEDNRAEGDGEYIGAYIQYKGKWKNSKPTVGSYRLRKSSTVIIMQDEEKGKIQWANGNKYEGQIKNQRPQGRGKMSFQNGCQYDGQWNNGVFQGDGVFTWDDGKVYRGHYVNGLKEGRGQFKYSSTRKYEGDWKGGKQNGLGKLFEYDNLIFSGQFVNGAPVTSTVTPHSPKNLSGQLNSPQKLQYMPKRLNHSNDETFNPYEKV